MLWNTKKKKKKKMKKTEWGNFFCRLKVSIATTLLEFWQTIKTDNFIVEDCIFITVSDLRNYILAHGLVCLSIARTSILL